MPIARKATSEMVVYAENVKTDVVDVGDLTIIISAIGNAQGKRVFGHTPCVATADTTIVWSTGKSKPTKIVHLGEYRKLRIHSAQTIQGSSAPRAVATSVENSEIGTVAKKSEATV